MNYEEREVPEGADQEFSLQIFKKDPTTGSLVPDDLTAYDNVVIVVHNREKQDFAKYSVASDPGFDSLVISGTSNNVLTFLFSHVHSSAARGHKCFFELRSRSLTGPGSFYRKMIVMQYLCTVPFSLIESTPDPS